jgi:hypothetical protein
MEPACQSDLHSANHFRLNPYKARNTKKLSTSQTRDRDPAASDSVGATAMGVADRTANASRDRARLTIKGSARLSEVAPVANDLIAGL